MKKIIQMINVTAQLACASFLWLLLSGIDRTPTKREYTLKDLEIGYDLPALSMIPENFYILIGGMIGGFALLFIVFAVFRKWHTRKHMRKIAGGQARMKLDTTLGRKNVSQAGRDFLRELCETDDPSVLLSVVNSHEVFEEKTQEYKNSADPTPQSLHQLHRLRNSLGFMFKNHDVPFINTRMLEPGLKLNCRITYKEKEITFSTKILEVNESQWTIKPPTTKGKPAKMTQFRGLTFLIERQGDADYRFTARVLKQLNNDPGTVVLEHTKEIQRAPKQKMKPARSSKIQPPGKTMAIAAPYSEAELARAAKSGKAADIVDFPTKNNNQTLNPESPANEPEAAPADNTESEKPENPVKPEEAADNQDSPKENPEEPQTPAESVTDSITKEEHV